MGEVFLWGVLAVVVGLILRSMIREFKNGSCSGCSAESECSGSCCSCSSLSGLKELEERLKDR